MTAGDDDGVDAFADGDFLDVWAVADEENDAAVFVALQTWDEGVLSHGAHHQELFSGFRAEGTGDEGASKGGDDVGERSGDDAGGGGFVARGEEMTGDLERAEQAEAALFGVGDGQSTEAFIVDQLDGVVDGGVGADGEHLGLHDIAHLWADIGEEGGGLDVEETKDEIDALVGVASSSGHDVRHSGEALELCVGECCADGVHVGIFVTDNDREHVGRLRLGADFGEEDGGWGWGLLDGILRGFRDGVMGGLLAT